MKLFISSYNYEKDQNINNSNLVYRIPCVQFKNNGWKIATIDDLPFLSLDVIKSFCDSITPSVILIWMCSSYILKNKKFLCNTKNSNVNIKLCWYIDDLHNNIKQRFSILKFFDVILNSYEYCFNKFYGSGYNTYWFPHYVNENLIKNIEFNNDPVPKIFLSGQITQHIYPARHKALIIAKNDERIYYLSHPGYKERNKHDYCGSKYYSLMNNFLAAFTCCARNDRPYIVSKFFEIIACGTLLIAYDEFVKEELRMLGFVENENYISCTMENMQDIFDYVLNPVNIENINVIRKNGFELSKKNSFLCNRVNNFCKFIEKKYNYII